MRIHSKFRDYYDTAMGYGQDPTLHYNRKRRSYYVRLMAAKLPASVRAIERPYEYGEGRYREMIVVGFCGTFYPAVCFLQTDADGKTSRECVYTEQDFLAACEAKGIQLHGYGTRARWHDYFDARSASDATFLEVNAPAFVIRYPEEDWRDGLTLDANAPLKDVEFYKVKDAFTAFQDVAGYLGNQLVKRDEPLEVGDEYRIAQHGFDKFSFRKQKGAR